MTLNLINPYNNYTGTKNGNKKNFDWKTYQTEIYKNILLTSWTNTNNIEDNIKITTL